MNTVATYRYLNPSALAGRALTLQTSGGPAANPRFFTGFLTRPVAAAAGLLAVAEVARTRYHRPVVPASLDPVVTGGRDRLRFESFSGCCGVYARLDVTPDGLDGDIVAHGTTNVDVNPPLRDALARVGGLDPLHLAVGPDDLTVSTMDSSVVERKVPLPRRWLRGFAEVQVTAAGMDLRAQIPAAEAATLLRRLPGAGDRSVLWAVPAGRALRLTSRAAPGAVCLSGAGRLAALRGLLRHASALRVYGPPVAAGAAPVASVWELDLAGMSLSLALSPEPARGFSGEGGVLPALAGDEVADDAELIGGLLDWDPSVDVDALAEASGLAAARVRAALTLLGTAGRVGYDVARAGYFHRVLPYDPGRAERDNPRLTAARALVEAGAVTPDPDGATVRAGDQVYRVRQLPDGTRTCTCTWWARHRGGRGPCRHALAAAMVTAPVGVTA
ncbi:MULTISPECIES: SWIM zinc finger family protein [unclassified Solwaraspora]|uniref:SWIM zinc finger family protein n=1 Tax=unclassified Solwaraspora TaxID=2627926 RepID=UPI00248B19FC|nr:MULTISPECIES: SWIM zinc finger family protein [unclassified Solwaraspora]WBB99224.1 SWIM zinc finger domain-containing protein [Solwaraspora sp. WMMA2059]WBC22223.1 SWIM zinc finger domain-containing protein [Solwaraspora sp. WMMA2080]WJK35731.1 SWIM zinc finger family protein [Solwaraspora sp. WMMA2065]